MDFLLKTTVKAFNLRNHLQNRISHLIINLNMYILTFK